MARRPVRKAQEAVTDKIPTGPLGFAGDGKLTGAAGLLAVGAGRVFVPLSEFNPGYSIESQEKEVTDSGTVRRTFRINAYSKDVAKFIAKRKSAPTNADFLLRDIDVVSTEPITERSTATEWEVVTETESRAITNMIEDNGDN